MPPKSKWPSCKCGEPAAYFRYTQKGSVGQIEHVETICADNCLILARLAGDTLGSDWNDYEPIKNWRISPTGWVDSKASRREWEKRHPSKDSS
jgi:hypothetical protein